MSTSRPLDLIVPFYREPALAESLLGSLEAIEDELAAACCSLFAVNDSPDDTALQEVLGRAAARFRLPFEVAVNPRNLGFVTSANAGLKRAALRGHDALLLNSDTLVFPGAIPEMRRIAALEPLIGFVNPRSNNATICSLPHQRECRALPPAEAHRRYAALARYLPEFQFVPTGVGFCLLIKLEVLEEFGFFDECYSPGYNEENDLILRANRGGYRVALANRAFVYHAAGGSFDATEAAALERRNEQRLHRRYPEYAPALRQYLNGPQYRAERLLGALPAAGAARPAVAFDFSYFAPLHNGTFTAGKRLLESAARLWPYDLHVVVSPEARRFHRLDDIPGLHFTTPEAACVFAASLCFGQPFTLEHFGRMAATGLVNVYVMLDAIGYDCLYLRQPDLDAIWSAVFAHADGVVYISRFTAEQFRRRFSRRPGLRELVCPLSLDVRDHAPDEPPQRGEHLLIVGNHFSHKFVAPTARALREAFPGESILALGLQPDAVPGVRTLPSGPIEPERMRHLFRTARLIIFPSLYEGFGLPIMEGLAHRRPVLARDLPTAREIRDGSGAGENLILYSTTRDLVRRLQAGFPVWREEAAGPPGPGWDEVARTIGRFVDEVLAAAPQLDVLLPRLEHVWALESAAGGGGDILALKQSFSWRLTAPLRAASDLVARLTGGRVKISGGAAGPRPAGDGEPPPRTDR